MISAGDVWRQIVSGPGLVDSVCNFIIRPPRSDYEMDDLGPEVFRVGDGGTRRYDRTDFELENMRGVMLQCSWFRPVVEVPGERREKRPCVVYCHANCGSRYDGLEALFLLEKGFTLFTFDFCGSGMSGGEYISLGFYERQDLAVVVEFLHSKTLEVDGVGLWGRSMGAVTAVMYAAKDPGIRCIVCDSPFASLRLLIQDLVTQHGGRAGQLIPGSVVAMIVNGIRKRIAKRAAFDIDDLDTLKYAAACTVPALIFHGEDDDFVSPQQSLRVQRAFPGACLHELTSGGHNDERDEVLRDLVAMFFRIYMVEKPMGERERRAQRFAKLQEESEVSTTAAAAAAAGVAASAPPPEGAVLEGVVKVGAANRTGLGSAPVLAPATLSSNPASAVITGTVQPPPPPPPPRYAEPIAGEEEDDDSGSNNARGEGGTTTSESRGGENGTGIAATARPVFSQTEEHRPFMVGIPGRPQADTTHTASGDKGKPMELGKGQTGPINIAKPRMTAAVGTAASDAQESSGASPPLEGEGLAAPATPSDAAADTASSAQIAPPVPTVLPEPQEVGDESIIVDCCLPSANRR